MLKKLKTKLKSRAGLTLTEMLVTIVVLMFFSTACLIGITTALSARRDSIMVSDADILCSTVTQVISQEMRLSLEPDVNTEGHFKYKGGSTAAGLTAGESELWLGTEADGEDKGILYRKLGANTFKPLNNSAYSNLKLQNLKFESNGATLSCSFEVIYEDDEGTVKVLKTASFTVTPINP